MSNLRDNYERVMKEILTRSVRICEDRCIAVSNESDLSNYERSCLGKCFDKYLEMYEKNIEVIGHALADKKPH